MAKIFNILTNPNPALRQKSQKLDFAKITTKNLERLCRDMTETMRVKDGVGLAAPQIGKNIRLAVINTQDGPICLINPKIIKKSIAKEWGEEGCLSVSNVRGEVKRHKKITCYYFDQNNNKNKLEANGLMARVIQHEIDHLDGILFIDKMRPLRKSQKK